MNEALVLGEALDVEDNRIRGVAAFSGARAHFRNIVVRNTRDFEGGSAASVSLCGVGTASAGAFGGTLELSDFLLTNSDLVGFSVGTGGDATLSNGEVNDNPIGVFIEDGDFVDRIHCLERGVLFLRNDVNLDAPVLPLPCPISDPCPPPDPNVCAHVPFDPIWAT